MTIFGLKIASTRSDFEAKALIALFGQGIQVQGRNMPSRVYSDPDFSKRDHF